MLARLQLVLWPMFMEGPARSPPSGKETKDGRFTRRVLEGEGAVKASLCWVNAPLLLLLHFVFGGYSFSVDTRGFACLKFKSQTSCRI